MGLFKKKNEGGFMDMIRCDETDYLIWKWRPKGAIINDSKKENAIRWGSSLRVKDGEVAVFVYRQKEGTVQDFIVGPYDDIIKTANFPVISSIIGWAYDGGTPFQAEVYFLNLSGINQIKFGIPYFEVYDPRFLDFGVPTSVRGSITFNIEDYRGFIKLHRLTNFELEQFKAQIKDALIRNIKGTVTNIPTEHNIPAIQMERKILEINDIIEPRIKSMLENDFGVTCKRLDISTIEFDKESEEYQKLIKVTREQQEKTIVAQNEVSIQNLHDTQRINSKNMEESLRIQREELQRAQQLQTESQNLTAHQLNQQTKVAEKAAESIGKMGSNGGGTMDPGSMMASMAMGGAVGSGMAGMMGNMISGMGEQKVTPPPLPQMAYFIAVNGQQQGPYNQNQMLELVKQGALTRTTHVWKQGMADWALAGNIEELNDILGSVPPPPPIK
ncbi:MAG: virion core protein (lumpy skin disease virus)-like protein [Bacteroidetes bacterium OLB9]|nr:MAG: virion core protein (lumpy skin disease virus)-like protein [Bacteroidetes bacterium OLB9]